MSTITQFFHHLHSVPDLIRWGGLAVLFAILFAETGLLIGFFLPGDSLLVTAGLFAARGDLPLLWLLLGGAAAAIVGQAVGYWVGQKLGDRLYARQNSRLFKREHLLKTAEFYRKHGVKAIVLGRFVPIVRTFVPVVAGVARMPYPRFILFTIWGGIGWVLSLCLFGFFLGQLFPQAIRHIDILVVVIVALSLVPMVIHALQERASHKAAAPVLGDRA